MTTVRRCLYDSNPVRGEGSYCTTHRRVFARRRAQAAYDRVIRSYYPDGNVPTGEDPADRQLLTEAIMAASAAYDNETCVTDHGDFGHGTGLFCEEAT